MPPGTERNEYANPNGMVGATIAPLRSATRSASVRASMASPIGLHGP